jgi:hypothetical protein
VTERGLEPRDRRCRARARCRTAAACSPRLVAADAGGKGVHGPLLHGERGHAEAGARGKRSTAQTRHSSASLRGARMTWQPVMRLAIHLERSSEMNEPPVPSMTEKIRRASRARPGSGTDAAALAGGTRRSTGKPRGAPRRSARDRPASCAAAARVLQCAPRSARRTPASAAGSARPAGRDASIRGSGSQGGGAMASRSTGGFEDAGPGGWARRRTPGCRAPQAGAKLPVQAVPA